MAIECPRYVPRKNSKRCHWYRRDGGCFLPDEFMCVEWLKLKGIKVEPRTIPADDFLWWYNAEVVKIVDGDTLDLRVDLGFHVTVTERFRLTDVDAWEVRGEERERGLVAKAFVEEFCPVGSPVIINTDKDRQGKYGRWLARIFTTEGECLNVALVEKGHADND